MAIKDTEYMYSSARVRALEGKLLTAEKYMQIIEATSKEDAIALLGDSMPMLYSEGIFDLEASIDAFLSEAFDTVKAISPNPEMFKFLQYEFDANNIKAAIKGFFLDIDPSDMMFSSASVDKKTVIEAVRDKNFDALPKNMARASGEAIEAYASTKDPQKIDLLLDKAAFADMCEAVAGEPLLEKMVSTKIDYINAISTIRAIKSGSRSGLNEILLDGGSVNLENFKAVDDFDGLIEMLKYSDISELALAIEASENQSVGNIERLSDDLVIESMSAVKFVPFGLSVLCGYLFACLYQAKNLRIIFALRDLGESRETMRERMRASYV